MKMKIILCTLLFISAAEIGYTQAISISQDYIYTPPSRDLGTRYAVDTCNLFVTYQYSYVTDIAKMKRYGERMILEIGEDVNRFYSMNSELRDSITYNDLYNYYNKKSKNKGHADGIKNTDFLHLNETTTYYDIYTYPEINERVVSARFGEVEYQYNEDLEKLNWKILPDIDTIVGYVCHKAETKFRGRKWYAWFTMEIPYNFGPWKLGGLPGMILKAEDSEGLFNWIAIGLQQPENRSIYNYSQKAKATYDSWMVMPKYRVVKCKRKDIARLRQRQWVFPASMFVLDGTKVDIYVESGSKFKKIDINMNDLPDIYYPRLELDM